VASCDEMGHDCDMAKRAVADLTGWLDYDRADLGALDSAERIEYFEKRVRLVALNPLRRIFDNELHGQPGSSALLIFAVSVCCSIEALGRFLTGGEDRDPLNAFLARYMDREFQTRKLGQDTFGTVLRRHFRNGLAHGFAVKHGGFQRHPHEPYFDVVDVCGVDCLEINPTPFFDDYVQAFERYLADLRAAQPTDKILADFEKVFQKVFVEGK
jgi:hypothetical protein